MGVSFALMAVIAKEIIGTERAAEHAGCIYLSQTVTALMDTPIRVGERLLLDAAMAGVVPQSFP